MINNTTRSTLYTQLIFQDTVSTNILRLFLTNMRKHQSLCSNIVLNILVQQGTRLSTRRVCPQPKRCHYHAMPSYDVANNPRTVKELVRVRTKL